MNYKGRWIKIQSYKHDGTLHRFWRKSYVLDDNDDWLIVASKVTQVIEGNGRKWYTKEPAISFFAKNDWYNVIGMVKTDGIVFYTNLASPTLIDRGIAKYVDYDLDVKRYSNGSIRYLDKNEHVRNAETYQYGAELTAIIEYKQKHVVSLIESKTFPYIDEEIKTLYARFLLETAGENDKQ